MYYLLLLLAKNCRVLGALHMTSDGYVTVGASKATGTSSAIAVVGYADSLPVPGE